MNAMMSDTLRIAIEATKKGAEAAIAAFRKDATVRIKNDSTPITAADIASENAIIDTIKSYFPNAQFVGEETGGSIENETFWIIDPVDATRSFAHGLPLWCVLLALYEKGDITIGVCYFPSLSLTVYAEKGLGAYANGERIHVSHVATLATAYVAFGTLRYFQKKESVLTLIEKSGATRSHDTSFNDYLVASGKMDVSVDGYAQVWDAAPFKVIIEEAGGKITNLKGEPWSLHERGIVISNGILHNEIITILNA